MIKRIALVTDFAAAGPYLGQLRLVLDGLLPGLPVIDLVSDLPPFRPDLAAYLIPQLVRGLPSETLFLCVVDPGVGGERGALALQADGNWFVGPDNGLLALVAGRAAEVHCRRVDWRPQRLSASFHGRDLFAPIGGRIVQGGALPGEDLAVAEMVGHDWPKERAEVIYRDVYGNLCSGIRAQGIDPGTMIAAGELILRHGRTFCDVPSGTPFWYENSFGLIELAVNRGRADRLLGLEPGDAIELIV